MTLFNSVAPDPKPLRPYQECAIDMLLDGLKAGHRRQVLKLPTGAGKTRVAAELIIRALARGEKSIFVVPRISLIEQTAAAFEREGIAHIGVIQGQHYRTDSIAPVQIASAQTLARRNIPNAGLAIIDECHLRFAAINNWLLDPESARVNFIGLSATPWAKGMGKLWQTLVSPVTIGELIQDGFLCQFRVLAPPGPDLTGVGTTAGDFNEKELSVVCDQVNLVGNIVETWQKRAPDLPTLCYGVDRKHAQHLQERFIEAGIAAGYVDCDTPLFEREEIFDKFRCGDIAVICNVATLDTGLDLNVRCIIDARPTKSRIRFVQTIGRGLRPGLGKGHCLILDHAGNHHRLGLVTDIDSGLLDDGEAGRAYNTAKQKSEPRIRLCPECSCVQAPGARECPQCGHVFPALSLVREVDGELIELGRDGDRVLNGAGVDETKFIAMVKGYAVERGYQKPDGFTFHKFMEKFGRKPKVYVRDVTPVRPDVVTRNWIRSRAIAFAKARQTHG